MQSLLSSLGMKGTPTLGKAKKLKEKRELAAELGESPYPFLTSPTAVDKGTDVQTMSTSLRLNEESGRKEMGKKKKSPRRGLVGVKLDENRKK